MTPIRSDNFATNTIVAIRMAKVDDDQHQCGRFPKVHNSFQVGRQVAGDHEIGDLGGQHQGGADQHRPPLLDDGVPELVAAALFGDIRALTHL